MTTTVLTLVKYFNHHMCQDHHPVCVADFLCGLSTHALKLDAPGTQTQPFVFFIGF